MVRIRMLLRWVLFCRFKKFLKEDEAYAYIETHRIRDGELFFC